MGFKGNVKSVLIKKFDATEKNGNIEKTDKSATEISILNFDTNNNLIESIIYNSDKSSIKELKKYNYNNQNKLESIEETNNSKYTDNYKLKKFTYPENNKLIEKWYNSDGDNINVWNITLDNNSNPIVSSNYKNGTLNWYIKNEYDNKNRLIKSIAFQKDSVNFSKDIITYNGLEKTIETYKKNGKLFYKEVEKNNKYGDIIKHTHYNSFNQVTTEPQDFDYEYDKQNNWIIKKTTRYMSEYDKNKDLIKKPISTIIERTIEYYD